MRAAATALTRIRAPLFSSILPTYSRKRSGTANDGGASAIARASAASTTFGMTSTRGMPYARSSPAMASLTASVAPARRSARRFNARSSPMYGMGAQESGAGAGMRPTTQRVMGPGPHSGQSAPWLMRVDQKQTGQ